jgi:hypothetical protein
MYSRFNQSESITRTQIKSDSNSNSRRMVNRARGWVRVCALESSLSLFRRPLFFPLSQSRLRISLKMMREYNEISALLLIFSDTVR